MTFDEVKTDAKKGTASITVPIAKGLSDVDAQAALLAALRTAIAELEADHHTAVQSLRDKEML